MYLTGNLAFVTHVSASTSIRTSSCNMVKFKQFERTYILITGTGNRGDSNPQSKDFNYWEWGDSESTKLRKLSYNGSCPNAIDQGNLVIVDVCKSTPDWPL
jgi:hypothetical protein